MRFSFDLRTKELLRGVWGHGSVSAAAARIGMDPANALRHLRTAERRAGVALVERRRGGRGDHARLTATGRRRLGTRSHAGVALPFEPDDGVTPIRLGGRTLYAAGVVAEGPVDVVIPPEAVALERGPASSSSVRNRFPARVGRISPAKDGVFRVRLTSGSLALHALVVRGSIRDLRLRVGSRVWATVKASSLHVSAIA